MRQQSCTFLKWRQCVTSYYRSSNVQNTWANCGTSANGHIDFCDYCSHNFS